MKVKSESEVAQSCLTLSDPMDYSLPGSSTHGIFQARVLEWGAIAFSETSVYKVENQRGLTVWHRELQEEERAPTPVFSPGESRAQRSLVGCRPQGRTESDMTEAA